MLKSYSNQSGNASDLIQGDTFAQIGPLNFFYSGFYRYTEGNLDYRTIRGYYWLDGFYSIAGSYNLRLSAVGTYSQYSSDRGFGFILRCLARQFFAYVIITFMEEKRFDEWIKLKEKLHFGNSLPIIHENDIWWCSFGENVGVEINGKNQLFSRPVFILKKLSRYGFIGIPLSSQQKTGSWYVNFDFQGKQQVAVLSQIRTFSVSRLSSYMGRLDKNDSLKIKNAFTKLIS